MMQTTTEATIRAQQLEPSQIKVAVTSKAFAKNANLVSYLAEKFPNYQLNFATRKLTDAELVAFLHDSDAVILALEQLNRTVLAQLPQLKVVAKFGVGLDNIDFAACAERQLPVLHRAGVNKMAVAELALCQTLMLIRQVYQTANLLAQGIWHKDGGVSLTGKTVGIVGFGHVGTAFASLLAPFGCRMLVCDILDKTQACQQFNATQVSLAQLQREAQVISLHCPLTSDTAQLVNAEFLAQMRSDAILINTARGELVDLSALEIALKAGQLAGAALDVYPQEPPTALGLLAMPNVVATPHIGGNSREATEAMGRAAIDLLWDFCRARSADEK
jgi:D-3-phosphoglycerate dehydrogenase